MSPCSAARRIGQSCQKPRCTSYLKLIIHRHPNPAAESATLTDAVCDPDAAIRGCAMRIITRRDQSHPKAINSWGKKIFSNRSIWELQRAESRPCNS